MKNRVIRRHGDTSPGEKMLWWDIVATFTYVKSHMQMGMLVFRKVTKRGFSNLAIQEWKELWDIVLRSPALLGLKQGLMFIAGNAEERIRASASWSDKRILKVPFQTSGPRFLSLDSYHPSWDNVTPSSQFPCWFYLIIKSWKRGWWQFIGSWFA